MTEVKEEIGLDESTGCPNGRKGEVGVPDVQASYEMNRGGTYRIASDQR